MQSKNYKNFCPTKQKRIVAKKITYTHQNHSKSHILFKDLFIMTLFAYRVKVKDDLVFRRDYLLL